MPPQLGERVKLFADEDNPEEWGTLLEGPDRNGVWVVEIDNPELGDDGLREVTRSQFEVLT